jgi:hypothetical protein
MQRPERLMLDWIIGVATTPERFPRDSEAQMEKFGLTRNQREVLLTNDAGLIRQWVAYELGLGPGGGVTHFAAAAGTHGIPPPPPPPPPPDEES